LTKATKEEEASTDPSAALDGSVGGSVGRQAQTNELQNQL